MEDIAPELLASLRRSFAERIERSSIIDSLYKRIENGSATYAEAEDFAYEVGKCLAETFKSGLSSAVLPDGKMYYNIADRVIRPLLSDDHTIVSDAAAMVQKSLNKGAGIGLQVKKPKINEDRVAGIIDKVSDADQYDDVAWVLDAPVVNFSQSVVDDMIKNNVEFHGKAGLAPKIIRKAERKCCKWCKGLAGEYEYPDVPHDVYRRHENCRCTVLYDPADGSKKRQNVHTKKLTQDGQSDTIEERRKKALGSLGTFRPGDLHNTIQRYVAINRSDVAEAAKANKRHSGVYVDAMGKTMKQLQRSIINRTAEVERHADKIQHPETYIPNWTTLDSRYQAGLLRKWEKDMRRNAEQAEIELSVFEERF